MKYLTNALCAAGFALAASTVQAATVVASKEDKIKATVTCTDCIGFADSNENGMVAATERVRVSTKGSSAEFVNRLTGTTSFDARDATKVETDKALDVNFLANFQYIVFKTGNQQFLIENRRGNAEFSFESAVGNKAGLKHYTGFGRVGEASGVLAVRVVAPSSVPVPASGLLLGGVVLGGGMMLRRKRKKNA